MTVDHALGTTTLPRAPERVVALGGTDADVAVVLGVTPVGVSAYDFSADGFPPC